MTATPETVAAALRRYRFRFADEDRLQVLLGQALAAEGLPVEREVRLDPRNRIDFLVGGVGVEAKVAGSAADVRRQLDRYARFDRVDGLVLVTTKAAHRFPSEVRGKPLEVVSLVLAGL